MPVKAAGVQWVHRIHDRDCSTKREQGRCHLPEGGNTPQVLSVATAANAEMCCPEYLFSRPPSELESRHALAGLVDGLNPSILHQKMPVGRSSTGNTTKIKGCEKDRSPRHAGCDISVHGTRSNKLSHCDSKAEDETKDSYSASEYGDESLESTKGAESSLVASSIAGNKAAGHRVHEKILKSRGDSVTVDGMSLSEKNYRVEGERLQEAERAGAVKIEACWRGFRGRCEAKCVLRSILHNALRTLGDGRMSKVKLTHDRGQHLYSEHTFDI